MIFNPKGSSLKKWRRNSRLIAPVSLLLFILGGCGFPTISSLVDGLNYQTNLELVCDGSSSYLLLLDSLLAKDPNDVSLLINSTKAYSAYVMVTTECGQSDHSIVLSEKTREYGLRLLGEVNGIKRSDNLEQLTSKLKNSDREDVESLFWGAYGWAKWISYQQGAPAAVIDLPKVELIMKKVIELDETFYYGGAHIFMGIYHSSKPVAYGGDPEASRRHFEKALEISGRRFLSIQVAYAENYAKMVFDRELYKKLLDEVMDFDISSAPDMTLSNLIAQKQAKKLLEETDDYF